MLPPLLEEIYLTGLTDTAAGGQALVEGSGIDRGEALFLAKLVGQTRPRVTLEIGLGFGLSALAICHALKSVGGQRHLAIDPKQTRSPRWAGAGLLNLQRAGFENLLEFFEDYSYAVLPQLAAEGRRVDFAFVDGRHLFDYVLTDFFYIDLLLPEGGLIVFDDADWPAIRRVLRFIVANRNYEVVDALPDSQPTLEKRIYQGATRLASVLIGALSRLPRLNKAVSRAFGADLLGTDRRYGLEGRCIALRKGQPAERSKNHFIEF